MNSDLVDPSKDDLETGETPSFSFRVCCSQEQNTVDVALTVIKKNWSHSERLTDSAVLS